MLCRVFVHVILVMSLLSLTMKLRVVSSFSFSPCGVSVELQRITSAPRIGRCRFRNNLTKRQLVSSSQTLNRGETETQKLKHFHFTRLSVSTKAASINENEQTVESFTGTNDNDNTNRNRPQEETLFALSSGGGGSTATAVAVIRITGPQSHEALQILLSKTNKLSYTDVKLPKARYASLRMLYDPPLPLPLATETEDGGIAYNEMRDPLDSSLVLLFNSPSSFTGQDMVEIHSHGSRAVVQGVLSALSRLSQPPYNINIRPADR